MYNIYIYPCTAVYMTALWGDVPWSISPQQQLEECRCHNRSALETSGRELSEGASLGIGTLLLVEQPSLKNHPKGGGDLHRQLCTVEPWHIALWSASSLALFLLLLLLSFSHLCVVSPR